MNQNARKEVLRQVDISIASCAGNQDLIVGKNLKDRYDGENIREYFGGTGLAFVLESAMTD